MTELMKRELKPGDKIDTGPKTPEEARRLAEIIKANARIARSAPPDKPQS